MAVAQAELGPADVAGRAGVEVEAPGAEDHVGGLRAVPARVHAHRAADRARDADVELEARHARRRGPPREHRERHRRAARIGTPSPAAPAHRMVPRVELLEVAGEHDRDAGEPRVGDEQVGAPADDQDRRTATTVAATRARSDSRSARTSTASGPPQR